MDPVAIARGSDRNRSRLLLEPGIIAFFCFEICGIVAGVFTDVAAGFEAENVFDRTVEKVPVVADDDEGTGEIVEVFFERDECRDV